MNKIKTVLSLSLLSLSLSSFAAASTNAVTAGGVVLAPTAAPAIPTDPTSFAASVGAYFTTLNPELASTFGSNPGTFWVGVESAQGQSVPIQNEIGVSYAIYKAVSLEAAQRDGGVTGGIISEQVGVGLSAVVTDVKATLAVDFVRDIAKQAKGSQNDAEIDIRIAKALTTHTFMQLQFGVRPISGVRSFGAATGFTF